METGLRQLRARAAVLPFPQPPRELRFDLRAGIARLVPSGRALLLGLALLAGGALAYLVARETPIFAIRQIRVIGATPQVGMHVRAALRPLEGMSLVGLDGAAVARRLEALPDVSGVQYDRAFPHTLRVFVQAETPVAVVRRGPDAWVVSEHDRVISKVAAKDAGALARIWVPHGAHVQVGERLSDAQGRQAVQILALARSIGFQIHVRLVRTDVGRLALMLRSGLEVRLGSAAVLPLKVAIAKRILPFTGGLHYLDLSVPERPVAG